MSYRYTIETAIEEWRDQCVEAGIDAATYTILYDPNMIKDLSRHIMVRLREAT